MPSKIQRILVAEDDNFQRMALFDLLDMCKYEPVTAENGVKAMELLNDRTQHFDLVLLDLNMPEMDGFEVLRRVKADDNLS